MILAALWLLGIVLVVAFMRGTNLPGPAPTLCTLALTGCAAAPHQQELDALHARFTYRADIADEHCIAPPGRRFVGDCEDFAYTLQGEIGGEVWHVVLPDGRHHAVVKRDGWVYDNLHKRPVKSGIYPARWLRLMPPAPEMRCTADIA